MVPAFLTRCAHYQGLILVMQSQQMSSGNNTQAAAAVAKSPWVGHHSRCDSYLDEGSSYLSTSRAAHLSPKRLKQVFAYLMKWSTILGFSQPSSSIYNLKA
eukprot:GHUV01033388.1.p1 GENE.GHUV01033388.1~~GHUV01033388.1.p1  ORF type:complete len:101 (-),score=16.69 GHUV01033388.1:436-738(-)